METLVINLKNKKDSKLIRELLDRMNIEVTATKEKLRQQLPKSKFKSADELRAMGGILKGQLISKDHLRNISWKKRNW